LGEIDVPYNEKIQHLDERRNIVIPGNEEETIEYCLDQFINLGCIAIANHGFFTVALSGGSTPKAIFKKLSEKENAIKLDYSKVLLFWSDERAVPPDDPENNYKMAMDAGFKTLDLPTDHIFPMDGTGDLAFNAKAYQALIEYAIPSKKFDLVMLGMGDDGHTASLFPGTKALDEQDNLVAANEVPQKNSLRLTLTYPCINQAKNIVIYVLGKAKADMISKVFNTPLDIYALPVQGVGTKENKALFVLDDAAASLLIKE
jgi:6-phosphogluconolactonase